ncbi:hypothetical protein JVT61DRAFT_11465 [Boletus reticuloceps]|uniref:Uncharacterized protein n=1 Tax=Boletus reticuloceps TaxID=495285 RepID=A0A8I2YXJ6_9AGAM|nr:hypothetical protein JVT61DRAFT_11465 [Boletus reticuloceps]
MSLTNPHLEDVLRVFPYYQDLNAIWRGILSFDSELVSSKPGVNHAESLLRMVKPGAKAPADEHEDNEMREDNAEKEIGVSVTAGDVDEHDEDDNMPGTQWLYVPICLCLP